MRAMFRKNLTLQVRRKGTLICQVFFPVILILFVGILQLILDNTKTGANITNKKSSYVAPIVDNLNFKVFSPDANINNNDM